MYFKYFVYICKHIKIYTIVSVFSISNAAVMCLSTQLAEGLTLNFLFKESDFGLIA